jgi:hypothetical protein
MESWSIPEPHPPLDFPLVGIADWSGDRWVDFFEGQTGEPVWSVRLGHAAEGHFAYVCTSPRTRWNTVTAVGDQQGLTELAWRWLFPLIDLARPSLDDGTNSEYSRRVMPFALHEAAGWSNWEPAAWVLDGQQVEARVYRFGGAWVGVGVHEPEGYLAVTARDQTETTLQLATVDGADYGWDFARPFSVSGLNRSRHPVDEWTLLGAQQMMPEHRRVLSTTLV